MNFESLGAFPIVRNKEVCGLSRIQVGIPFQFSLTVWRPFNFDSTPHHSFAAGSGDYLSRPQHLPLKSHCFFTVCPIPKCHKRR